MTPRLTDDQRQAIERTGGKPVDVVDPATNLHYVLLRADQYEAVRPLFEADEADLDPRRMYPYVAKVFGPEGWDDPAMDVYDDLDPRKDA